MRIFLNILILLVSVNVFGQTAFEINLNETLKNNLEKNVSDKVDETYLYINDERSNELFYYALKPKNQIKATLLLLPSTAERIEDVLNNNIELSELAHENGILLILPSINWNFYLDEVAMDFLNTTFKNAVNKYGAPENKVVIGGFSLGGMNAIRYAELSKENADLTSVHPIAVYGIDPPLDLARLYKSFERTKELNFSEPAVAEANHFLQQYQRQFGGTPDNVPDIYINNSMYSRTEKVGGNAKFLVDMPVRIYSDPDIDWHLNERKRDLYDVNVLDQTAFINQLRILGNENAEFINALGKGYRLNGRRHPHSWSIVEPNELIDWIIKVTV